MRTVNGQLRRRDDEGPVNDEDEQETRPTHTHLTILLEVTNPRLE